MNLVEKLNWRYAVKRMNSQKVPDDKVNTILEAIRLAPSSLGLQPYTVIVVESADIRAKIAPAIRDQPQITEGSHVLVFASWTEISEEKTDKYISRIAQTRGVSLESLQAYRQRIRTNIESKTPEQLLNWNKRQAYIALGFGLAAAAELNVDSTPMEGFDPEALDEVLGLKEKGLQSTVILTLGYRDAEKDALSSAAKVRRASDELFIRL